jgi:hypothetical protein
MVRKKYRPEKFRKIMLVAIILVSIKFIFDVRPVER